ncbi:MAG TPA: crosslink repair DNA glycosylase YcaQ family protein [Streptosporangiaceae bacterium]|nr:crosslink repair DNA glycosylase YcaQ family protein [Streptosporangiaceae bacterium]
MTPDRLGLRALNRAALHRQLLLDRAPLTALQTVGHLAGLQAQAPLAPYVGLWTRLAAFRHQDLRGLISERALVRSPTPNAAGSSRTAARSRCRPATAGAGERCSSTACGRPTGRSARAAWRSGRSSG